MPRGPEDRPSPGGGAEQRQRQFERSRGLDRRDAEAARVVRTSPPGGKALQRMVQFEAARGLVPDDGGAALAGRRTAPARAGSAAALVEALGADVESPAGSPVWRPLGPTVMHNGQTYGFGTGSRVDVSGRVSAIAVDPSDGRHILVGSAAGGVWESRDRGATWAARGDGMATLTVGALCFDPRTPAVVYLGTGEGDSAYSRLGQGLYRSTDGGSTWALRAARPFVGEGFHRLVVDPIAGDVLYAATPGGLHTSADGGLKWTRRHPKACWGVSVDPGGGEVEVLAACFDGIRRSTDRGVTWTPVELPDVPVDASIVRIAVSHGAAGSGVAWAWAATRSPDSPPDQLPDAWLLRRGSAAEPFATVGLDVAVDTKQAWYDWHVHAAPDSEDVVYVGEINLFRVERTGAGWTWTVLSSKSDGIGDSIHPDQHCMAFDPVDGNVVYAGCDGGIFRSPNRGTSWSDLNDGLAITEIEYLAHDVGSANWLLAGTQDNGTIRYTGRADWDHVVDGDGGDCASSSTDPDVVYHSFFNMGIERSTDRGDSWAFVATGNPDPQLYNQLFYPPMEANGPVVAQAGESVFVSRDFGVTFTEVRLPGGDAVSAMAVPTTDRVYAGTGFGDLFRIDWTGSEWATAVRLTSPREFAYVSDLLVDPLDARRMWATSSRVGAGRVFRSDDGGTTWTDRSAGLPALPVNAVEVHPEDPDRVWVAADKGVYESRDGGATWSGMSLGLPNCLVADLLYHRHARVLRAGTRSRGVWECPIERVEAPICAVEWTGRLEPGATDTWSTSRRPASWHMQWTVHPTTIGTGTSQLTWGVAVERVDAEYVTYRITVTNLTDRRVSIEGRSAVLSYR
jgi:photosystem II stability/assembly factor-like uncharacterized protein